jgi:hypothetical protein
MYCKTKMPQLERFGSHSIFENKSLPLRDVLPDRIHETCSKACQQLIGLVRLAVLDL